MQLLAPRCEWVFRMVEFQVARTYAGALNLPMRANLMKSKIHEADGVPITKTPAGRQAPPRAVPVARASNDGAPFYSSSAALYFEKMRAMLNMPPRDELLWARMTIDQRQAVLVAAGYPAAWSGRQWSALTWREQTRIINQVQAFAAWALKLQVPQ